MYPFKIYDGKIKIYRYKVEYSITRTPELYPELAEPITYTHTEYFTTLSDAETTSQIYQGTVTPLDYADLEWLEDIKVLNETHAFKIYEGGMEAWEIEKHKPTFEEQLNNLQLALIEMYEQQEVMRNDN